MLSILKFAAVGFLIYGCLVGFVWFFQERIAFPAPRSSLPEPAAMGIRNAERVSVRTADGVDLYGWYLRPVSGSVIPDSVRDRDEFDDREYPALIWFYGNFETVSTLAPVLRLLQPPGWGVLALDIRGYGESQGRATERGFYLDAEAAWDFLAKRPEIDSTRIAVYGRSLGTALALHLASSKPVSGVILEAPFTSGRELGRKFYWWVPSFLVKIRMNNLSKARQIEAPLLVLHGTDDQIVPLEMGRSIAEAGRADAFMVFEGAGHNEMLMGDPERYRSEWMAFLGSIARRPDRSESDG